MRCFASTVLYCTQNKLNKIVKIIDLVSMKTDSLMMSNTNESHVEREKRA